MTRWLKMTITLLVTTLIWESATHLFHVPSYLVPAPSVIIVSLVTKAELFATHSLVTFSETLLGFFIGVVVGVLLAAVIVIFPAFTDVIMPLLLVAQIVPKVAIAPILLIWFGYGLAPKILIAFLVTFFPIVVDTATGLDSVEREMLDLARSLKASRWQIFYKFRIPTALPYLFSGMKVSVTLAIIGAIIAEFVGGSKGLGYLIIIANQEMSTDIAFAALVILSVGGIALYALVELAERILIPWHVKEETSEVK